MMVAGLTPVVASLAALTLGFQLPARAQSDAQRPTLAERLGYAADAKLLIIHADDIGVAQSVNAATLEGFRSGVVNSGSIMVPCPWFPDIAAHVRQHPDLDLGLHLTLTAEWEHYRWGPVLPRDQVPSLVDSLGFLYPTQQEAAQRMDPGEAEAEIRAQVERAIAFGVRPTHLDSHMGTLFQTPELFAAYLRVGREYRLPVFVPGESLPQAARLKALLTPDDIVIDRMAIATPAVPADRWQEFYQGIIEGLQPGVTEIIVHLAHDDAEMRAVTTGHPDYGAAWRQRDLDVMTSPRFAELLARHGVHLITWREIGALLR